MKPMLFLVCGLPGAITGSQPQSEKKSDFRFFKEEM